MKTVKTMAKMGRITRLAQFFDIFGGVSEEIGKNLCNTRAVYYIVD